MKTKTISISLPADMIRAIKRLANERRISVSAWIKEQILAALK